MVRKYETTRDYEEANCVQGTSGWSTIQLHGGTYNVRAHPRHSPRGRIRRGTACG